MCHAGLIPFLGIYRCLALQLEGLVMRVEGIVIFIYIADVVILIDVA